MKSHFVTVVHIIEFIGVFVMSFVYGYIVYNTCNRRHGPKLLTWRAVVITKQRAGLQSWSQPTWLLPSTYKTTRWLSSGCPGPQASAYTECESVGGNSHRHHRSVAMLPKETAAKQQRFEESFNSYKATLCFTDIRQCLIYTYALCF